MYLTSAHIYLAPQRSRVTVSIPLPKLQTVISVTTTKTSHDYKKKLAGVQWQSLTCPDLQTMW